MTDAANLVCSVLRCVCGYRVPGPLLPTDARLPNPRPIPIQPGCVLRQRDPVGTVDTYSRTLLPPPPHTQSFFIAREDLNSSWNSDPRPFVKRTGASWPRGETQCDCHLTAAIKTFQPHPELSPCSKLPTHARTHGFPNWKSARYPFGIGPDTSLSPLFLPSFPHHTHPYFVLPTAFRYRSSPPHASNQTTLSAPLLLIC